MSYNPTSTFYGSRLNQNKGSIIMENQFRIKIGSHVRCNMTSITGIISGIDINKGYLVKYSDNSYTWFTFAYLSKCFTVVEDVEFPKLSVTELAKKAKQDIENILKKFEQDTGLSVYMTYNSKVGSEDSFFNISAEIK